MSVCTSLLGTQPRPLPLHSGSGVARTDATEPSKLKQSRWPSLHRRGLQPWGVCCQTTFWILEVQKVRGPCLCHRLGGLDLNSHVEDTVISVFALLVFFWVFALLKYLHRLAELKYSFITEEQGL